MPLSRATTVEGGMPMSVTSTETAIAAGTFQADGIHRLAAHQSKTVTAAAHVPEPGCKWPMPKKVAISQEGRDLGAVFVNASYSSGANLPYIHFVAGESTTCFDVAQASHQSFRFLRVSGKTGKLSQPLAKCCVQSFALSADHEFSLPE